jgi:hypothetical protein
MQRVQALEGRGSAEESGAATLASLRAQLEELRREARVARRVDVVTGAGVVLLLGLAWRTRRSHVPS